MKEKELTNIIMSLSNIAETEQSKEYVEESQWYQKIYPSLKVSEISHRIRGHEINVYYRVKELLAEYQISNNTAYQISLFFISFCSLSKFIESLINCHVCITDKTHFILSTWLRCKLGEKTDSFSKPFTLEHQYWEPDFGSKRQWIALIDGYLDSVKNPDAALVFPAVIQELMEEKKESEEKKEILSAAVNEYYEEVYAGLLEKKCKEGYITEQERNDLQTKYTASIVLYKAYMALPYGKITEQNVMDCAGEYFEKRKPHKQ